MYQRDPESESSSSFFSRHIQSVYVTYVVSALIIIAVDVTSTVDAVVRYKPLQTLFLTRAKTHQISSSNMHRSCRIS